MVEATTLSFTTDSYNLVCKFNRKEVQMDFSNQYQGLRPNPKAIYAHV